VYQNEYQKGFHRGMQFVSDLINHENKQFYSFEQIQEKLETNNFLMFYRLIARIPKAFKDCLKENTNCIPLFFHSK
jgi:hypothetical protein